MSSFTQQLSWLLVATIVAMATVVKGDWRIVNGTTASKHEFPSIVSIKLDGMHFCGGTLLKYNTVLTAAHCLFDFRHFTENTMRVVKLQVVVGEHDQNKVTGKEKVFQATQIIIHPEYRSSRAFIYGNDVALLKFEGVQRGSEVPYIKYVHIALFKLAEAGMQCEVAGWGSLDGYGNYASSVLQKASINILSNDECARVFGNVRTTASNVCAGSGALSTSACKGDSGGPLFCKDPRNGQRVQVGIVSYGRLPCGTAYVPTVYTRVSEVAPWIMRY